MSVSNGQQAVASTFNDAFISKTTDSVTTAVVGLNNTTDANSGVQITNTQRKINEIADSDGTNGEGDASRKIYSSTNVVTNGDNRKVAIGKLDAAVAASIPLTQKGAANGVATLDSNGRLPSSQLPIAAMEFLGSWNATTNTPALIDGTGSAGDIYRVSVAGTQDLGSGSQTFQVGDWVAYSGTIWQVTPNSDLFTGVLGNDTFLFGRNAANTVDLPIAKIDASDRLIVGGSGGAFVQGVKFFDADSSNHIEIKSADTVASNFTLKLPAQDGSPNNLLATDGAGNLSFVASAGGAAPTVQTFPSGSGTWNRPTGCRFIRVTVVGGGGGGGGTGGGGSGAGAGGGGGGGATCIGYISLPAATLSYAVGGGGSAGGAGNSPGGTGGTSTFSTFTANGGNGGGGFPGNSGGPVYATASAGGGTASGGTINTSGHSGFQGVIFAAGQVTGGQGGASVHGSGGRPSQGTQSGASGGGFGGGGSGGSVASGAGAQGGGAGTAGVVIVEEFY